MCIVAKEIICQCSAPTLIRPPVLQSVDLIFILVYFILTTLLYWFSLYNFFIITSVLRLLNKIYVHCYTYHTTFMHFRYLQLDIFTLINNV